MTINLSLPQKESEIKPRITVIGVGGAGGNAVNNMISAALEGVEFIVANETKPLYLESCKLGSARMTARFIKSDPVEAKDLKNLLNHYQITKTLSPYHQHNEHKILQHLTDQLTEGKKMALVTDAGTPGISDPAFLLIRECIKAGIKIECLLGPTAFVPALINSGIPFNRFAFEGFLPLKKGRQTLLKRLAEEDVYKNTKSWSM